MGGEGTHTRVRARVEGDADGGLLRRGPVAVVEGAPVAGLAGRAARVRPALRAGDLDAVHAVAAVAQVHVAEDAVVDRPVAAVARLRLLRDGLLVEPQHGPPSSAAAAAARESRVPGQDIGGKAVIVEARVADPQVVFDDVVVEGEVGGGDGDVGGVGGLGQRLVVVGRGAGREESILEGAQSLPHGVARAGHGVRVGAGAGRSSSSHEMGQSSKVI